MKRRVLALLLVCLMLVSVVPTMALAEDAADGETAACPGVGEVHTLQNTADYTFVIEHEATCTELGGKQYRCNTCGDYFIVDVVEPLDHPEEAWVTTKPGKDPTCTQTGLTEEKTCSLCEEVVQDQETIDALGHVWGDPVVTGDCLDGGSVTRTCKVCGTVETTEMTEGEGHKWITPPEILVEPTCSKEGLAKYECSVCGETKEVVIKVAPTLHDNVQLVPAKDSTCSAEGNIKHYKCMSCGELYEDEECTKSLTEDDVTVEKKAHTAGAEATCTTAQTCTVCGEELTPALEHDYTVEGDAATCTEDGTLKCVRFDKCGATIANPEAPATGHSGFDGSLIPEDEEGEEETAWLIYPSCDGKGDYKGDGARQYRCKVCGELVIEVTENTKAAYPNGVIPTKDGKVDEEALVELTGAHVTVTVVVTEANCVDKGLVFTFCARGDRCTEKKVTSVTKDKVTYKIEDYAALQAYGDALANLDVVVTDIDTTKHKGTVDESEWKCGDEGKYGACDAEGCQGGEKIPAEHDWEKTNGKLATCDEEGRSAKWVCKNCGAVDPVYDGHIISKLPHKLTKHEAEEQVCEDEVYDEYYSCDVCGKNFSKDDVEGDDKDGYTLNDGAEALEELPTLEALGHDNNTEKTDSGKLSCTTFQYQHVEPSDPNKECSRCGKSEEYIEDYLPATGHSWVEDKENSKEPTCTEPGVYAEKCENCDGTRVEENLPATGHKNSRGEVLTEDCDLELEGDRECVYCNKTIEAKHAEENVVKAEVAMVCGENDGYYIEYCRACGKVITYEYREEMAPEHKWVVDEDNCKEATCAEAGEIAYKCDNCDSTKTEKTEATGNHTYEKDEDASTANSCEEAGEIVWVCSVCGDSYKETVDASGHADGEWVETKAPTFTEAGEEELFCPVCGESLGETRPVDPIPGFYYIVDVDNAVAPGAGYTDSSLVKVTISVESAGVDVWGMLFDVAYDSSVMEFVGVKFVGDKFTALKNANDNGGYITLSMYAPNTADSKLQNKTIGEKEAVAEVYFLINNPATEAYETTITVSNAQARNIDPKADAVAWEAKDETIEIGVFMDSNDDNSVDLADLLIMNERILAGDYDVALDLDKDGELTINDLVMMNNYMIGALTYEDLVGTIDETVLNELLASLDIVAAKYIPED